MNIEEKSMIKAITDAGAISIISMQVKATEVLPEPVH